MQFVDAVYSSSSKRTEFKRTPRDVRITSERESNNDDRKSHEREEGEGRRAKRWARKDGRKKVDQQAQSWCQKVGGGGGGGERDVPYSAMCLSFTFVFLPNIPLSILCNFRLNATGLFCLCGQLQTITDVTTTLVCVYWPLRNAAEQAKEIKFWGFMLLIQ